MVPRGRTAMRGRCVPLGTSSIALSASLLFPPILFALALSVVIGLVPASANGHGRPPSGVRGRSVALPSLALGKSPILCPQITWFRGVGLLCIPLQKIPPLREHQGARPRPVRRVEELRGRCRRWRNPLRIRRARVEQPPWPLAPRPRSAGPPVGSSLSLRVAARLFASSSPTPPSAPASRVLRTGNGETTSSSPWAPAGMAKGRCTVVILGRVRRPWGAFATWSLSLFGVSTCPRSPRWRSSLAT